MSTAHPNRELVDRLLGPAEPEVSCEECFELLDQYVDLELAGDDADARLPGMRAHLQGCRPATRITRASVSSSPVPTARRRNSGVMKRPGAGAPVP